MATSAPVSSAHLLTSPALSTTSASSFDMVSSHSPSLTLSNSFRVTSDDSDDEIIWSVSEGSLSISSSECSDGTGSDDDFVILTRPPSPIPLVTGLSTPVEERSPRVHTPVTLSKSLEGQMDLLSLSTKEARKSTKKKNKKAKKCAAFTATSSKKQQKKTVAAGNAYPSPAPSPKEAKLGKISSAVSPGKPGPKNLVKVAQSGGTSVVKYTGLGSRPIVDDISDRQSVVSYDNESVGGPTLYDEASTFISSFLSNPEAKHDSVCRLTLLQSLIIELGLATSSLPVSLKSAKAFLKSRAFLNIREYIAVRGQGPEAVQRVMYPSRSALIKDIRKKRNATPLKWVKQHGLQVLLVGFMH